MPNAHELNLGDFRDICFVIMPFGKKIVGSGEQQREVNFDDVYTRVFEPAIAAVSLPQSEGGGRLRPIRTDKEFFTGDISHRMFELIEYSRFALADITAVNSNVFYELGARHRAHASGTAIFRQQDGVIPFDISQIKAFPYVIEPEIHAQESRATVTRVLTESLRENMWDSPIMLALRAQRTQGGDVQDLLLKAENALRDGRFAEAHERWLEAIKIDTNNPRLNLKASDYPKSQGNWEKVVELLYGALAKEAQLGKRAESSYSDAYRELGIAQNKKDRKILPTAGEESLRRAVYFSPQDYDAWASLGGILRRANGREAEALAAYEEAVKVSDGHPYPLLMALKLKAKARGVWQLSQKEIIWLAKAQGFRTAQTAHVTPIDVPWSYFDLAEIQLYLGDVQPALSTAKVGLALSNADWMPGTFLSALQLLPEGTELEGLAELKALVEQRVEELKIPANV